MPHVHSWAKQRKLREPTISFPNKRKKRRRDKQLRVEKQIQGLNSRESSWGQENNIKLKLKQSFVEIGLIILAPTYQMSGTKGITSHKSQSLKVKATMRERWCSGCFFGTIKDQNIIANKQFHSKEYKVKKKLTFVPSQARMVEVRKARCSTLRKLCRASRKNVLGRRIWK